MKETHQTWKNSAKKTVTEMAGPTLKFTLKVMTNSVHTVCPRL